MPGCGASCIYPLLGNKMNNWKFIATEVNVESHAYAVKNVLKNCAEDSVKGLNDFMFVFAQCFRSKELCMIFKLVYLFQLS